MASGQRVSAVVQNVPSIKSTTLLAAFLGDYISDRVTSGISLAPVPAPIV
jgi:hypothetical protein